MKFQGGTILPTDFANTTVVSWKSSNGDANRRQETPAHCSSWYQPRKTPAHSVIVHYYILFFLLILSIFEMFTRKLSLLLSLRGSISYRFYLRFHHHYYCRYHFVFSLSRCSNPFGASYQINHTRQLRNANNNLHLWILSIGKLLETDKLNQLFSAT